MSDVLGQRDARWALEVAAAGGHHVLMVGPPGAGKTMLAARLPGLLPDLGERVAEARAVARRRLAGTPWSTNSEVPGSWLRAHTRAAADRDLDLALDSGALSLRGVDRVLRVAWTLADLAGRQEPGATEVGQALLLRTRGRVGR